MGLPGAEQALNVEEPVCEEPGLRAGQKGAWQGKPRRAEASPPTLGHRRAAAWSPEKRAVAGRRGSFFYTGRGYSSEVRAHVFNLQHVTCLLSFLKASPQQAMERVQALGQGAEVRILAPLLPKRPGLDCSPCLGFMQSKDKTATLPVAVWRVQGDAI